MQKNVLAICDSEQEYAYRLMDALSNKADFPFEMLTFTSKEKLYESLQRRPVQVLLVAHPDFSEEMKEWVPRIILLWEGIAPPETDLPGISKYSSVVRIMKKITETASGTENIVPFPQTDHPVHFLGFYTPVRRCLQTTLAFAAGQHLCRAHKVLYLNFERFSGLEALLGRSFEKDFSDLLFHLQKPREEVLGLLYQIAEPVGGMDFVPPAFSGADIMNMNGKEWLRLLAILRGSRYDYVILDLSDCIQGLFEILQNCARIYTVVRQDAFAAEKLAQYEAVLRQAGCEAVLERTKRCQPPLFTRLPGDLCHLAGSELAQFAERMLAEDGQG